MRRTASIIISAVTTWQAGATTRGILLNRGERCGGAEGRGLLAGLYNLSWKAQGRGRAALWPAWLEDRQKQSHLRHHLDIPYQLPPTLQHHATFSYQTWHAHSSLHSLGRQINELHQATLDCCWATPHTTAAWRTRLKRTNVAVRQAGVGVAQRASLSPPTRFHRRAHTPHAAVRATHPRRLPPVWARALAPPGSFLGTTFSTTCWLRATLYTPVTCMA